MKKREADKVRGAGRSRDATRPVAVAAVSGGPDSVYLLERLLRAGEHRVVIGHVNHGARGDDARRDQEFVRRMARELRLEIGVHRARLVTDAPGFEEKARTVRREYLRRVAERAGAAIVATGHTADDQVETVLMRFFRGAGIAGLKGIPRGTEDGVVRPILDLWKDDIVASLARRRIPFRTDRSNRDTRFERNWIRHVVIPLLEARYGGAVKRRIFETGERFRELDEYLDAEARRWVRRHVAAEEGTGTPGFRRAAYARLPAALRVRILQRLCFERLAKAPGERLLRAADRMIRGGGPSARTKVAKGWELVNRYERVRLSRGIPGADPAAGALRVEEGGKATPAGARRIAAGGAEVFDAAGLRLPLSVRPVRRGDRIRPFGGSGEKKLKELFIDRKVPREERWGRPAVCDADGRIVWIPGVVRSALAPVTATTRCARIIRYLPTPRGDGSP